MFRLCPNIIQKYESFCFLCNLAATSGTNAMLLIFSPLLSKRLDYTLSFFLKDLLGLSWSATIHLDEYRAYPGPKLVYAPAPLDGEPFIEASGLLFDNHLLPVSPVVKSIQGVPVIFTTNNPVSILPFDPFAAAFYMVSRYEEYQNHQTDLYGRFLVTDSIAWKGKFLDRPIVHEWAGILASRLLQRFPLLTLKPRTYKFLPTIDIDHAYAYGNRSLIRVLGGIGRSVAHGRFGDILERFNVWAGWSADPYDNYAYIREVHRPYGHRLCYFVLFAGYGGNDNNIPVTSQAFRSLVQHLDRDRTVGIHPSLASNTDPSLLESEYFGLCQLLGHKVTLSRQHFLKLSFPITYQRLVCLGITDDFSMGYASHLGFRAGVAMPFPFFDLSKNEVTSLIVHPIALMDVTLKDYLRLNGEQALEKTAAVVAAVKSVNGELVSLWHNESLGDKGRWKGWRQVYEEMVRMASS